MGLKATSPTHRVSFRTTLQAGHPGRQQRANSSRNTELLQRL